MVNLCDTQGGGVGARVVVVGGVHFWGGVWPLDSSNTSAVGLALGKSARRRHF